MTATPAGGPPSRASRRPDAAARLLPVGDQPDTPIWLELHPEECPFSLGNRSGYTRHGCRCRWCRWGNSAYIAHYREQSELPPRPEQLPLWEGRP